MGRHNIDVATMCLLLLQSLKESLKRRRGHPVGSKNKMPYETAGAWKNDPVEKKKSSKKNLLEQLKKEVEVAVISTPTGLELALV